MELSIQHRGRLWLCDCVSANPLYIHRRAVTKLSEFTLADWQSPPPGIRYKVPTTYMYLNASEGKATVLSGGAH